MKRHADGVGGESDCRFHVVGSDEWVPMLDREIEAIEKRFTIASLDEAVSRYWMGFDENQNLDELTQSELNLRRARYFMRQKKS